MNHRLSAWKIEPADNSFLPKAQNKNMVSRFERQAGFHQFFLFRLLVILHFSLPAKIPLPDGLGDLSRQLLSAQIFLGEPVGE